MIYFIEISSHTHKNFEKPVETVAWNTNEYSSCKHVYQMNIYCTIPISWESLSITSPYKTAVSFLNVYMAGDKEILDLNVSIGLGHLPK